MTVDFCATEITLQTYNGLLHHRANAQRQREETYMVDNAGSVIASYLLQCHQQLVKMPSHEMKVV